MTTIAVEMLKAGMVEAVVCVQRYGLHPTWLKRILVLPPGYFHCNTCAFEILVSYSIVALINNDLENLTYFSTHKSEELSWWKS